MSQAGAEPAPPAFPKPLTLAAIAMIVIAAGVFLWALFFESGADGSTPAATSVISAPGSTSIASAFAVDGTPRRAPPRHDPNAEPNETPPATPAEFPVYDAVAAARLPVATAPAEAADAAPANERATAIRAAADGAADDELALLNQTLAADPVARNRLLAINGLRRLGLDPAHASQVLSALRSAQADPDQNVARSARHAYEELSNN